MTSKLCYLRQHLRGEGEAANLTDIHLSLDDNVIRYLIRGPNEFDGRTEEKFELYKIDEIDENRSKSGSLAILCIFGHTMYVRYNHSKRVFQS